MAAKFCLTWLVLIALITVSLAQTAPTPAQSKDSSEDVVRIGVTLVQVDAVVTDRSGRHVTDLKPDDFIVKVDGHTQKITNFSYISTVPSGASPAPPVQPSSAVASKKPSIDRVSVPDTSGPLKPEQVHRTFALVVDDLTMSSESIYWVRKSLKKFVAEQMQPGDLAAIIKTSGGIGLLQQFTANREQLYAAIDKVQWSSAGMGRTSSVDLFAPDIITTLQLTAASQLGGANVTPVETDAVGAGDSVTGSDPHTEGGLLQEFNQFRQEMYSVGTLGTLDYIIHGLKPLPGRKSLVLFSDGFRMFYDTQHDDSYVVDPLRNLVDLANRSSVVIYTVDSRGLQTLGYSAGDNVTNPIGPNALIQNLRTNRMKREREFFDSQQGLGYLASETGGLALSDTNDLSQAIAKVADDQTGYYLIGFVPDDSVFKTVKGHPAFHNISVAVTRAGLHVRSRQGFIGTTDEAVDQGAETPIEKLAIALSSPFGADDINLKLTALFWHGTKEGSFIYSLLHIDPRHLTFADLPDKKHQASFQLLEMTFGDNGRLSGRSVRTETVSVSDAGYRYIMDNGLLFANTTSVKGNGALQYRVAVQDKSSGKVGTASSFVAIPDLSKHRLALSGVFLRAVPAPSADGAANRGGSSGEAAMARSEMDPALRAFAPGANLDISFMAYNVKSDKTGHADLNLVVRLVKDGKVTFTGKVVPFHPDVPQAAKGKTAGAEGIGAEASFKLGDQLEPGSYALQVICNDKLAKPRQSLASQWIDFAVVKGGQRR